MVCQTCRYNDPPGLVRRGGGLEPCPDCNHAPKDRAVLQALEADSADEARYGQLAAELEDLPEGKTIH